MAAIVYTAIFGDYDTLKQPVTQTEPCDFICFSDKRMPARVGAWRIIRVKPDRNDLPLESRRLKLLSHRVFPNGRLAWRYAPFSTRPRCDLLIWIDGSVSINNPAFVQDMRAEVGSHDWAVFAHPDRDCIYDEALAILAIPRHQGLPVLSQTEAYRSVVPSHGGLYASGIIVRRQPAPARLNQINDRWWLELQKWTYRDQLSLPYVLRAVGGGDPVKIRGHLWLNKWFKVLPHGGVS